METDEVKIVRLTTGEELLCECRQEESGSYILSEILILIPRDSAQLGLVPFMPYTKVSSGEKIILNSSNILFTANPVDELKEQHRSVFSKIVLPSGGGRIIH